MTQFAIRYRDMVVHGRKYKVPTHVTWIGTGYAKGWQVRFTTHPELNAFYNIRDHSIQDALDLATDYVIRTRPRQRTRCFESPTANMSMTTDNASVLLRVGALEAGGKPTTIYVGTDNTATPERITKALQKAIRVRKKRVAERRIEVQKIDQQSRKPPK